MELDELEITHDRAGPRCEGEALTEGARRIGAVQEQAADAAGRDDDAIGRKQHLAAFALGEQSRHRIVLDDQPARGEPSMTVMDAVS